MRFSSNSRQNTNSVAVRNSVVRGKLWALAITIRLNIVSNCGNLSKIVPTVAGLWWKKANLVGGVGAVVSGAVVYVLVQAGIVDVGLAPVVVALFASAAAMLLGGLLGRPESPEMIERIGALHR